jgi:hypothetical protein
MAIHSMIVGIARPGFFGAKIADSGMPDFWLPLAMEPLVGGQLRASGIRGWLGST